MTDEEIEAAVAASRGDWYARAVALGVEIGHNPTTATAADSWATLNPGADWAASEDAARVRHETWDWADEYGTSDHGAEVA